MKNSMNASAEIHKEKGHGILATAFWRTAPGFIIIANAARNGLGRLAVVVPGFATINHFLLTFRTRTGKALFRKTWPGLITHRKASDAALFIPLQADKLANRLGLRTASAAVVPHYVFSVLNTSSNTLELPGTRQLRHKSGCADLAHRALRDKFKIQSMSD
jgi:hypothetical protein